MLSPDPGLYHLSPGSLHHAPGLSTSTLPSGQLEWSLKKKKISQIIPFPCLTQPQGFPLLKVKSQQVTMDCRSCIIWRTLASLTLSPSSFPIFSGFQIPGLLFVSKTPICFSSQHLQPCQFLCWECFFPGSFQHCIFSF